MASSRFILLAQCCTRSSSVAVKRPLVAASASHPHTIRSFSTGGAEDYIVKSAESIEPFQKSNYTENLLIDSHHWSHRVALECTLTKKATTYGRLRDQVARWGGYLRKLGLGKGDVVAIVGPNVNETSPVVLGAGAIGVVMAAINPTYTPAEIADQLSDSNAKLVVAFSPLEPVIRAALTICKVDIPIVGMGVPADTGIPMVSDIFDDDRIPFADAIDVSGSDPLSILYSSGTTGKPKGVVISHEAASINLAMLLHPSTLFPGLLDREGPQNNFLMLLPMFHVGGLFGVHAISIHKGVRLVNYAKFDPKSFLRVLEDYQISVLHLVPSLLNFLVSSPQCDAKVLQYVKSILCGSAPMSNSGLTKLKEKVGRPIMFQQAYGMTETMFVTMDPINEEKVGWCGKLMPGVQAKVVDVSDPSKNLPPNIDGELIIKTKSQMSGYLNNAEATAQAIDADGWLHTGDVGHYDQEGYFKIVDRTKDLIKVKGFQVSPSEIEEVLLQVPGIQDVSVTGVPHDRLGEAPRAYIVAKAPPSKKSIEEFLSSRLSENKQLVGGIVFVDALPRNSTGKVVKKQLQQMKPRGD
uniref:4-coumarate--CoA ligase n=1 Tax=Hirondellea gigas TaxID=1518452 RepID=A0A2P2HZY6_9CRUS